MDIRILEGFYVNQRILKKAITMLFPQNEDW